MYGCESWTLRKNEETRLDAFEMKGLRKILRVSWTAKETNEWVLNQAGVKRELLDTVKARKLAYYGPHAVLEANAKVNGRCQHLKPQCSQTAESICIPFQIYQVCQRSQYTKFGLNRFRCYSSVHAWKHAFLCEYFKHIHLSRSSSGLHISFKTIFTCATLC